MSATEEALYMPLCHSPARTKLATVEMNPAKKALLGKVPAMQT
jgi:hypothetical protein